MNKNKNIWEDCSFGATLATEPIDEELNSNKTSILSDQLQVILSMGKAMKEITDIAFEAADSDGNKSLD